VERIKLIINFSLQTVEKEKVPKIDSFRDSVIT
jgi:hypothetical protein